MRRWMRVWAVALLVAIWLAAIGLAETPPAAPATGVTNKETPATALGLADAKALMTWDEKILIAQSLIFVFQLGIMYIQAKIYQRQEDIMRDTLALMRKSMDITVSTQRADVMLSDLRSYGVPWTEDWEMVPLWINNGPTSADVIAAWADVNIWTVGEVQPAAFDFKAGEEDMDIQIGSKDVCEMMGCRIPVEYSEAVTERQQVLIIEGRLNYRDRFSQSNVYTARFRYALRCDSARNPVWHVLTRGTNMTIPINSLTP